MSGALLELQTSNRTSAFNSEMRIGLDSVPHSPIRLEANAEHLLIQTLRQALHQTGYLPLRNLDVQVDTGCIRLVGTVRTYHLKQLAQSAVKHVPGIGRIVNDIDVV
jgi:osmotically-inducible protein OsmY